MIKIPLTTYSHQRFRVAVDLIVFELTLRFMHRARVWELDIKRDGTYLVVAQRVVLGIDLLHPYGLDYGTLIAHSSLANAPDPDRDDLGETVSLVWASAAEAAELAALSESPA